MSDMKHVSTKKLVSLEEHAVTVSVRELLEMILRDSPEALVDPRDTMIQVSIPAPEEVVDEKTNQPKRGQRVVFSAGQLLDLIRSSNDKIPEEGAELVLAVRWRQETEVAGQVVQQPSYQAGVVQAQPQGVPANLAQIAQSLGADPSIPASVCATCGSIPIVHGPTPDCFDPQGCGPVRQRLGTMPMPKTVEPDEGSWRQGVVHGAPAQPQQRDQRGVPPGGLRVPPGRAFNPTTGEVAFVDRNGMPYGKSEYVDDHLSRRNI